MISIKPRRSYLVALESVAMTDIVMNMFIFFFISFSLIYTYNPFKLSRIDVSLPKASSAVALEGSEKMVVSVTREGGFFVDGAETSRSLLKDAMAARARENPSIGVLLEVDGDARFADVSGALDAVNALGIERVSVAAEECAVE